MDNNQLQYIKIQSQYADKVEQFEKCVVKAAKLTHAIADTAEKKCKQARMAMESGTGEDGILRAGSGWTEIFIYPGYHFKMIDGLITNFHLPESTLLMLVSALAGKENIMHAYETAVQEKYRFFSFGDAMIII